MGAVLNQGSECSREHDNGNNIRGLIVVVEDLKDGLGYCQRPCDCYFFYTMYMTHTDSSAGLVAK
jgi:hypothetical protein